MSLDERASSAEELFVPIFLERYVLPILATCMVGVILMNPFRLAWYYQAMLAIVVTALAYAIGRALHKHKSQPGDTNPSRIKQQTFGANSPNIVGNSNSVSVNNQDELRPN